MVFFLVYLGIGCTAVNLAMSQWGEDVLRVLVSAMAPKLYIGGESEKSGETSMFPVKL